MKFLFFTILFVIMQLTLLNLVTFGMSLWLGEVSAARRVPRMKQFPEQFSFGASSAAYQIEGGWNLDGRTPSVWDKFTHEHPELVADHSNGDVSADSYHFFRSDVEALKNVGFNQYRFSISWSRVLTDGLILNPKGIEYYNKVIDALIGNQIEPIITIYHWDHPQSIQDLGGFANPLIVEYFKYFAEVLFENFGDRVKKWITFNEPSKYCSDAYGTGWLAPNIRAPGVGEYLCGHNLLQAHAAAYHLYKQKYYHKQKGAVGISLNTKFFYPMDSTVDQSLIERALEFQFGWFANPIFSQEGGYPQVMIDIIGNKSIREGRPWSRLPTFTEDTKKDLIGSADFLALNYYTSRLLLPKGSASTEPSIDSVSDDTGVNVYINSTWARAKSMWLYSVPEGMHDLLNWIKIKYNNPNVFISENGFSDDGEVNDEGRINYLKDHLVSVAKAIEDGCNVTGYLVWSIIDNFEWTSGYTEKFGIFAVNMKSPNRERTTKKSANFFKKLISTKTLFY